MRPRPEGSKRCRLSEGYRRKGAWARIGFVAIGGLLGPAVAGRAILSGPVQEALKRAQPSLQLPGLLNAVLDAALPIIDAIQATEGVATLLAIETLIDQARSALAAPAGIDGDQAVELSRKTSENFVVELLRGAYARIRAEPGLAWKEIRSGTYRYVVPGLIAGGYAPPIISFVVEQANNLKPFVEQTFHNPALLQIIDVISKVGNVP